MPTINHKMPGTIYKARIQRKTMINRNLLTIDKVWQYRVLTVLEVVLISKFS